MVLQVFVVFYFIVSAEASVFDEDLYKSVIDNETCVLQLEFLRNDVLGLKFIDASGKIPSGILIGNLNDLGDYHECLGIQEFKNGTEFYGKYCATKIPFPTNIDMGSDINISNIFQQILRSNIIFGSDKDYLNIYGLTNTTDANIQTRMIATMDQRPGLMVGICIPRVCTTNLVLGELIPEISEMYCRLPNDKPYVIGDYVAICLFAVLIIITTLSTSYDLYWNFKRRNGSLAKPLYRSFSVYTNTKRLVTVHPSQGSLECLDGIRVISMLWVIIGHTFVTALMTLVHNPLDVLEWLKSFSNIWLTSATISVDTFFLLSGILCVYTTIGKATRGTFIKNIHIFYILRLLRMFPLLATVVLFQATIANHVADGPVWTAVGWSVEGCRKNWWAALLHIQNYYNSSEICLGQTWYLSVDVQLYIVCPLVIVWLFGRRSIAILALIISLLAAFLSSSLYSFLYNFPGSMVNTRRIVDSNDYNKVYYINTLTRAPPFFVGMTVGYILHIYRNKKIRFATWQWLFLWCLSLGILASVIFTVYPMIQPDFEEQLLANFHNAYARGLWAVALGWVIFACVHGYGGPINWFLSQQFWKVPARLSYAMYLVHFPLMFINSGTWIKSHYFSTGESFYRFAADLSITLLISFALCVLVDAPFTVLQKLLFGQDRRPNKAESQNGVETDKRISTDVENN